MSPSESQFVRIFHGGSQSNLINLNVTGRVTCIPLSEFKQEEKNLTLGLLLVICKHVAKAMDFAHTKEMVLGSLEERHIAVELNAEVCIYCN